MNHILIDHDGDLILWQNLACIYSVPVIYDVRRYRAVRDVIKEEAVHEHS